ncbi:acyltransferase 3 [Aspergillus venezuelensis]
MARISWLDGLKGFAAFLVVFGHYFNCELDVTERSFWDSPPEDNRRLFQLPPLRLIFSTVAMVPLFMVLSGYSIALSIFKFRDTGRTLDFFLRLRNGVWRRPIRLFFPVLLISVISQIAYFFDLYTYLSPEAQCDLRHIQPWTDPRTHLNSMLHFVGDSMNIVQLQWNKGLSEHIWSMPFELRGSYTVYLVILGLSSHQRSARLWILASMAGYFAYYGNWDILSFLLGVILAEISASRQSTLSSSSNPPTHLTISSFTAGVFLLCMNGVNNRYPPEYAFLQILESPHWTKYNPFDDIQHTWHALGSALTVYGIANNPTLQRPFLTAPLQYLGRLHFSTYLVHQLVLFTLKGPLWGDAWWYMTGTWYAHGDVALGYPLSVRLVTWVGSGIMLGVVILVFAEVFDWVVKRGYALIDGVEQSIHVSGGGEGNKV